ncbi:50S ribosomal protein L25 [Geomesophilobacter sediminis]|uniref:Large ribosomal subunit protein bL25 n=1 Tax=Geomesophilobacter sediminis TaxID=2798584 RepID=A0A8J7LXN3_9BACT|nr:50S ribosomal protein L25 [Geomesophilobacter sediminis]MBJ6723457.1 50S ribosomal protein L25 [Geomesophilobacter sediminis]
MSKTLTVELREKTGKGISRRLRTEGKVPAVVYGKGMEPVPVTLNLKEFTEAVAGVGGRNHILTVSGGGALNGENVIVADLYQDCIKGTALHVDLHRINLADKVKVHVRLNLVGTSVGVKGGGFLDFACHQIEVECLPVHIPEKINVDITELNIGHSIHVGDIVAPVGSVILTDPSTPVVSILGRKAGDVEEAAAPAE